MNFKNQLEDYNLTNVKLAPQCMPFMHNFFQIFFSSIRWGRSIASAKVRKAK